MPNDSPWYGQQSTASTLLVGLSTKTERRKQLLRNTQQARWAGRVHISVYPNMKICGQTVLNISVTKEHIWKSLFLMNCVYKNVYPLEILGLASLQDKSLLLS